MAMTSQFQYTRVDPLIKIQNQLTCNYKQNSQLNAHVVNRAVCQILFSIDDMDPKVPLPTLQDCSRILNDFEKDKEFIRLLQLRVIKIVDQLIIPSMVLFMNGNGAAVFDKILQIEDHALQENRPYEVRESENIQILNAACNLIEQLVHMMSYGLDIDNNILEIVLDYLVTCFIVSTSGNKSGEQKSYEVSIVDTIFCILENVIELKQILKWFTSYSDEVQKEGHIKLLLNSMLNYFLASSKELFLLDPILMNLACICIEQMSGDVYKPIDLGSHLFEENCVIELNYISDPRSPRKHPANTVMVSPKDKSPLVQEEPLYLGDISMKESKAPCPPWLDIFTQLTPTPSNSLQWTLTTIATGGFDNFKPKHPHIQSLKNIWHKVRSFCSSQSALDKTNRSRHHWGKCLSFCQAMESSPKHTISPGAENNSIKVGHQTRKNMNRQKIDSTGRVRSHVVTKRKAHIGKQRHQLRREPMKHIYNNVIENSTSANGQKLYYYYKLNKRSLYAKKMENCTFEKTYVGQIKGRTHGLQLKYQSKIEKLEYLLRGYDK